MPNHANPRAELVLFLKIDSRFQSRESRKTLSVMVERIVSTQSGFYIQSLNTTYIIVFCIHTWDIVVPECGFRVLLWKNILLHGFCTLSGKMVLSSVPQLFRDENSKVVLKNEKWKFILDNSQEMWNWIKYTSSKRECFLFRGKKLSNF